MKNVPSPSAAANGLPPCLRLGRAQRGEHLLLIALERAAAPARPRRAAESISARSARAHGSAGRGSHRRQPCGAIPPPMMPGASTLAFSAGSSGRLTQNGMSIARTTTPMRPPGLVTRTISDSMSVGVALLEHRRGQGDIDRPIRQRQRLGAAFAEIDVLEQPFAPGQRPRLAQQIGAHVAADQTIGAARCAAPVRA